MLEMLSHLAAPFLLPHSQGHLRLNMPSLCVSLCQVLLHLVEEAGLPVGGPAYGPRLIADEYRGLTVWRVEGGVSLPRCFCPILYTL
jgi:hypothetical protein